MVQASGTTAWTYSPSRARKNKTRRSCSSRPVTSAIPSQGRAAKETIARGEEHRGRSRDSSVERLEWSRFLPNGLERNITK
jgi:hypothetical protein